MLIHKVQSTVIGFLSKISTIGAQTGSSKNQHVARRVRSKTLASVAPQRKNLERSAKATYIAFDNRKGLVEQTRDAFRSDCDNVILPISTQRWRKQNNISWEEKITLHCSAITLQPTGGVNNPHETVKRIRPPQTHGSGSPWVRCFSHRIIYRFIHKSLRDFRTRLRNNQDRHGRKEHINRQRISPSFFMYQGPWSNYRFHRQGLVVKKNGVRSE